MGKEPELNNLPINLNREGFPPTKSFLLALWIEGFR